MKYRAEIDGLRALAVVPVILFHAGFNVFSGGYVGVDVFFVISGYLITTIISDEMDEGRFSLIGFYERRARRILPALFFIVLVCTPFAWAWYTPAALEDFAQSLIAVATFSSNILFWLESGYFDAAAELKPLLHTWSLAVEEQYYILFPLFLMFTWRIGRSAVLTILVITFFVSLGVAHWGAYNSPAAAFYLLPTRGWEILLGAFCAFYLNQRKTGFRKLIDQCFSLLGLLLIGLAIFTFHDATPIPGLLMLVPTSGTALLILCANEGTWARTILSTKPFVGLGLVSYSAYLWHQPLLAFMKYHTFGEYGVVEVVGILVVALVLSILSWRYVEVPFRRRDLVPRKIVFSSAIATAALIIAVGLVGVFKNSTLGPQADRLASAVVDWDYPGGLFAGDYPGSFVNYKGQPVTTVFFGDSHAEQYGPLVAELSREGTARSILFLTGAGCPPLPGVIDAKHLFCTDFIERFERVLKENSGVTTVIVAACFNCYFIEQTRFPKPIAARFDYYYQGVRFRGGDGRTQAIAAFGQWIGQVSRKYKVVVVLDNPSSTNFDPSVAMRKLVAPKNSYFDRKYPDFTVEGFPLVDEQVVLSAEISTALNGFSNVVVIDPARVVCPDGECRAQDESGQPRYKDAGHMRPFFVKENFRALKMLQKHLTISAGE